MKITAILGSYRRGGIVESAVDELLAAAQSCGATVEKINLLDRRVEFCANCRNCTTEPGPDRGDCLIADDVPAILNTIEGSDAFVLAAPVNFWTVTAIMKRFIERTVCCGYWPWGGAPKPRRPPTKRAIIITVRGAGPHGTLGDGRRPTPAPSGAAAGRQTGGHALDGLGAPDAGRRTSRQATGTGAYPWAASSDAGHVIEADPRIGQPVLKV